jgi:hypothetical protein
VKLLSDEKPKVVQMAFETCATLAHVVSRATVLTAIGSLVDSDTLTRVAQRIDAGCIPVLTLDGALEFPYIANELTTQNSFFSRGVGEGNGSLVYEAAPV